MNEAVVVVNESFDAETVGGERYTLHAQIRKLWLWQSAIFAAVVSLPGIFVSFFMGWPIAVLAVLVSIGIVLLSRRYGVAYLRTFRCVLLPDGLLLKRGVVWQSETFIPRPRIQHTDVNEGPIARHFGIATLKIFTAGTHVTDLEVEGLPKESALALRDRLLGRDGHDAL